MSVWQGRRVVVCVGTGEVRREGLFIDVAELIWEPPSDDG